MLTNLINWTTNFFSSFGVLGLFILAIIEAFIFPVPVEVILIPLSIKYPNLFWLFALIAAFGSVLGGIIGYIIGLFLEKRVLEKIFSKKKIEKAHTLFQKYEEWAVFIGGFTPLPYKIFAVSAGLFYLNLKKFILFSAISRTLRFMLVAAIVAFFSGTDGFISLLNISTLVLASLIIIFLLVFKRKNL